jgi:hypothetical protein
MPLRSRNGKCVADGITRTANGIESTPSQPQRFFIESSRAAVDLGCVG